MIKPPNQLAMIDVARNKVRVKRKGEQVGVRADGAQGALGRAGQTGEVCLVGGKRGKNLDKTGQEIRSHQECLMSSMEQGKKESKQKEVEEVEVEGQGTMRKK